MTAVASRVTITRTLLSLADLTSTNASTDPFGYGQITGSGVQWQRVTVTSPWIHGRRLRSATKGPGTLSGELYVISDRSAHPSTHDTALSVLLTALGQLTYTFTVSFADAGGNTYKVDRAYVCEPADISPGESHMIADTNRWTTLSVSIPCSPLPSAGSW